MIIGYPPFYADTPSETCRKILNWRKYLIFPKTNTVSTEAIDLIRRLITDVDKRLGYNGADEIKAHPFFRGINWNNVKRLKPPFIPKLESAVDVKYFDKFDEEEPFYPNEKDTKIQRKDICFTDFTYKKDIEENSTMVNAINIMNEMKEKIKDNKDVKISNTPKVTFSKFSKPILTTSANDDKENKPINLITKTPNHSNIKINFINLSNKSNSRNSSENKQPVITESQINMKMKIQPTTCLRINTPKINIMSKIMPKPSQLNQINQVIIKKPGIPVNFMNMQASNVKNLNFISMKTNSGKGTPQKISSNGSTRRDKDN